MGWNAGSPVAGRFSTDTGGGWDERTTRWLINHHRTVLALFAAVVALASVLGYGAINRLTSSGWTLADAESAQVEQLLSERFGVQTPNLLLVASATDSVDAPDAVAAGTALTDQLRLDPDVSSVESYWSTGMPTLRSHDGRSALVLVRLIGGEGSVDVADRLLPTLVGSWGSLEVVATGEAAVVRELRQQSAEDAHRGELLAAPLALVILVLVFGSAVAALLPLVIGTAAVVCTAAILRGLAEVTTVSVFSLNITTALGFALAVDYSLFLLARYREELARGRSTPVAITIAVRTVGRAITVSALTMVLALAALLLFPLPAMRSFAYGGIGVTVLAALFSITVVPALLAVLGHRVNLWNIRPVLRRITGLSGSRATDDMWYRLATWVMRRPILIAGPILLLLLAVASPFTHASFGALDDRSLPPSSSVNHAAHQLRDDFDAAEQVPAQVVLADFDAVRSTAALDDYARRLSNVDGVRTVHAATGSYRDGAALPPTPGADRFLSPGTTWLSVAPDVEPFTAEGSDLVRRLQDVPAPTSALFGGSAAKMAEVDTAVREWFPLAATLVAASMFLLLLRFTRSLLLPLKALLLNVLSLTVSFGALVYVFQDGNLRWLVGDFEVTGVTDQIIVLLMFFVAFGLSMDYEVFLLSRIAEEYRHVGSTTAAVARGLQKTAGSFTAAAVLVAVVMLALATSKLLVLKMIGVGLALAVLLDATVIRVLLVPAVMRLAGRANWWLPGRGATEVPVPVAVRLGAAPRFGRASRLSDSELD
ncbi:membrane protein [Longimycelium tulufanense]|uniref:Membrane protein n=1 Tax=Longimycelium tulufanense TaxID=907463 RepID=A0A8J3CDF9_9PSEU|nr:MMPL family transporter [Longimycelium tulufanense]GGM51150.1 membrane protein [Longimycelium tulufanense]